jgi:Bifunctional DNA primase/polymerase, N-terminal
VSSAAPVAFAAVAQQLAERGWRPFPGWQASKTPAMRGWPGLNRSEWDPDDLEAAIGDYQPADDFCCCLAVPSENAVIDLDIVDQEHAAAADRLANKILGITPLVRIGFAPKQIRIYRSGDAIRSRKLHPLEVFSGTGQFIGYGWHEKAGRPYIWLLASPLEVSANSECECVLTNPPFKILGPFIEQALDLSLRVIMLARLTFLESERRTEILEHRGLARIYVFRDRLPIMHRDGWTGPKATSATAFAWFCWDRGHRGPAEFHRISFNESTRAPRPRRRPPSRS